MPAPMERPTDEREPGAQPDGEPAPPDDLERALAARGSRRWQLTRAVLVVGIVLVELAVVIRGAVVAPGNASAPLPRQVSSLVEVISNVSYGTVTVNGVAARGALAGDSLPVRVNLARGSNLITLDAPPFLPVNCMVSQATGAPVIEPNYRGRCAITFDFNDATVTHTVINILLTGTDLPPEALASAERVVAARLAEIDLGTATVPVGQYYATSARGPRDIAMRQATEPLRATLAVVAAPDSDDLFPSDAGSTLDRCVALGCASTMEAAFGGSGHLWVVGEALALEWRFTTAAGAVAGEALYGLGSIPVRLLAGENGGWFMTMSAQQMLDALGDPDACAVGEQVLTRYVSPRQDSVAEQARSEAATGIQGCEIVVIAPGPGRDIGLFVWRFGVPLAANAAAHAMLPALPLAPPDELRAVGI